MAAGSRERDLTANLNQRLGTGRDWDRFDPLDTFHLTLFAPSGFGRRFPLLLSDNSVCPPRECLAALFLIEPLNLPAGSGV